MEITRSINTLRRISVGLRVLGWVVLVAAFYAAVKGASAISFIPVDSKEFEALLPGGAAATGIVVVLMGVINWLILLALAEVIQVFLAIESNTRQATQGAGAKPAAEKVPAGR